MATCLPAVKEVIGLIAKHDLVLATGHVVARTKACMLASRRRGVSGVQRMVVTHAMNAAGA